MWCRAKDSFWNTFESGEVAGKAGFKIDYGAAAVRANEILKLLTGLGVFGAIDFAADKIDKEVGEMCTTLYSRQKSDSKLKPIWQTLCKATSVWGGKVSKAVYGKKGH